MFLYGLLAMRQGYFFKGPSEKENLELQLGMTLRPAFTYTQMRRHSDYACNC